MIKESLIALSLSTGGDLFTTETARSRGYGERNPLCARTLSCVAYSAAWTGLGTFVTHKVEKRHGKRSARAVLGLFCAVPLGAAISNGVKLW